MALPPYSLGYAKGFFGRKNVGVLGAFFNALLLATTLTFVADNIWLFLIAWEIMALTAYCLVSFEHEQPETRDAGVLYFIMSHIDAGCIILGFLLLFQASGDYSFASLHDIGAQMSPGKRDAAFLLFLLGFGIKAGIVPLHIWLPAAHPVAPSNVSALMSGVLIKTGIYGLTRVCFDFPRHAAALVGRDGADGRHDLRRAGRALRADGTRPQAAARLSQHRKHRHHPHGPGRGADVSCTRAIRCWPRSGSSPGCITPSITPRSKGCCSSARARCCTPRTRATWRKWAG